MRHAAAAPSILAALLALAPAASAAPAALAAAGRVLDEVFPERAGGLDAASAGAPADAPGIPLDSSPLVTQKELDEALLAEVLRGNPGDVERLLKRGADAGAKSASGVTALMLAAQRGGLRDDYVEVARLLLRAGAPAGTRDDEGETALHYAARPLGSARMIALIGAHRGARPDAKDDDGETPLLAAVGAGNAEAILSLAAAGADKDLAGGFRVGGTDRYGNRYFDLEDYTPLMAAAWMGVEKPLAALLRLKPDLHRRNAKGATALSVAVAKGNETAVKLLVAAGAKE